MRFLGAGSADVMSAVDPSVQGCEVIELALEAGTKRLPGRCAKPCGVNVFELSIRCPWSHLRLTEFDA